MRYSAQVMDHFYHPRRVGELDETDPCVRTAHVGVVSSGDVVDLQIRVVDGKIEDANFKVLGGVATIACCSWVTEWLIGKGLDEAGQLSSADIISALALPSIKVHCAMLVEDALKKIT